MVTSLEGAPPSPVHSEFTTACQDLYAAVLARFCMSAPEWMLEQPAVTVPAEFTEVKTSCVRQDIRAVETLRLQPYASIKGPDMLDPYKVTLADVGSDISGNHFLAISGIYTQTTKWGEISSIETLDGHEAPAKDLYINALGFVQRICDYVKANERLAHKGEKAGRVSKISHTILPEYSPHSVVSGQTPGEFLAGLVVWLPETLKANGKAMDRGLEARSGRIVELLGTGDGTMSTTVAAKIADSTLRSLALEKRLIENKLAEAKEELGRRGEPF